MPALDPITSPSHLRAPDFLLSPLTILTYTFPYTRQVLSQVPCPARFV